MSDVLPLLIEIGTEELPPKSLDELAQAFVSGICDGLKKRAIKVSGEVKAYCTPRRLAVFLPGVAKLQSDQTQERRGPAVSAGLDSSGKPNKALIGFAASCGVAVEQLEKLETDKGAWFTYRAEIKGQPTAALLSDIITESLKALPVAKPMRWGDNDYAFVRPVHWLVILHGEAIVDGKIFGIASGRLSRGHRVHHPEPVRIESPETYIESLRVAKVLADPTERRECVRSQVEAVAKKVGATPRIRDALLNEVNNLVEWPVAIACSFDRAFLAVPQEALVMTMESNQKFFPLFDSTGKLAEHFIGVANLESADPDEIRKGYERVIRPRFADAKFFFDEDRKTPLQAQRDLLRKVTYQQQLGSVFDKCERVAKLCATIAESLSIDAANVVRAAQLSKCDLMTRMVGEFPELQGVMGRYYAGTDADPETAEVANALDEFYAPRFAGDVIATSQTGRILAVAERLDTMAGIFSVGQKPSGNKDPFALRRAGLGLARTLIEGGLELDLNELITQAIELVKGSMEKMHADKLGDEIDKARKQGVITKGASSSRAALNLTTLIKELLEFIYDRLRNYYSDKRIGSDVFEAVLGVSPTKLTDFDQRIHAVVAFAQLPESQSLAAANKRIGNILKQAMVSAEQQIDLKQFESGAETELHKAIEVAAAQVTPMIAARRYVEALQILAKLRVPVDAFFENVMVMVDDPVKRDNRLAMLYRLRKLFLQVADISLMQPVG